MTKFFSEPPKAKGELAPKDLVKPAFQNDFGESPLVFAHITRDQGAIAVGGILAAFIAASLAGIPAAALVAAIALNDVMFAGRNPARDDRQESDEWERAYRSLAEDGAPPVDVTPGPASWADRTPPPLGYNLAEDMGQSPQTTLLVGVPGAGKGVLFSNAVRVLSQTYPQVRIVGVDPKADEKETGYWGEGFSEVFRKRLDSMPPDDGAAWLMSCINHFRSLPAPKLLVLDEGTLVAETLRKLASNKRHWNDFRAFTTAISSSGDSRGEFLWLVAQHAHCEDLGFSGGVRSVFRGIALLSPKNLSAMNAVLGTKFVVLPDGGIPAIMKLIESSPVGRAFFDGKHNRWFPMPSLQNFSGFNRDEGALRTTESVSDTVNTLQRIIQTEVPQNKPRSSQSPLSENHRKLLEYGEKKDWQTVRDTVRNWGGSLGLTSDDVRRLISELEDFGFIEWDVSGKFWRAVKEG